MELGAEAREIIARLGAVDLARPHLDKLRVEAALQAHLAALGQPARPVVWLKSVSDAVNVVRSDAARDAARDAAWVAARDAAWVAAWDAAWSAAWSAAWDAAWSAAWDAARAAAWDAARVAARVAAWYAAWDAAWDAARVAACERVELIERPFVDAFEAGLGMFWITPRLILALPQPTLQISGGRDGRLHCETGPAAVWPNGDRYWFWHGVRVPQAVVEQPEQITPRTILGERNSEVRRVMIERFGWERFDVTVKAQVVDHDERWGTLLRWPDFNNEKTLALRVVNRSPEPDGSYRRYVLPVHPELRPLPDPERGETAFGPRQALTALNAVASTFGMTGEEYAARLGAES